MTELNCESVQIAAMSIADGYPSEMSPREIEIHLAGCAGCRREVAQLRALAALLDAQVRRQWSDSVWPQVEQGLIPVATPSRPSVQAWHPFVALGLVLISYRLVEIVPDWDLSFFFKLVPILLVIAVFCYLRENPFKIETNLRLEGE